MAGTGFKAGRLRARRWASAWVAAMAMLAVSAASGQTLFERRGGLGAAPQEQVKTRLIADTTAIEAGRPFRLGVQFTMLPGWHIYWRYAGEVGLPTQIRWEAPEGFEIGELQWPNPKYIDDPATGLASYGWEGELLLYATVTPPETLPEGGTFTFGAESSWLACEVQCIPGSGSDRLELARGKAEASADFELFEAVAAQVAVSLAEAAVPLRVTFEPEGATIGAGTTLEQRVTVEAEAPWRLLARSEGEEATLFPDATRDLMTETPRPAGGPGEGELESLTFEWTLKAATNIRGGEVGLRPALGLFAVHGETGETRRVNVFVERPVRVEAAAAVEVASAQGASVEGATDPGRRRSGRRRRRASGLRLRSRRTSRGGRWRCCCCLPSSAG
jgi:DsbC/DsbD-like thiol-disulfide interchange protein